jgi:hypothetical protein
VDGYARELTRGQVGASEHKRNRIGADHPVWLSLNVSEIESKVPEHADVLGGFEMLEI